MTDLQVRLAYSKSERDDWTKVEDKALRKKIQDRLAKRKSSMLHSIASFIIIDRPTRKKWTKREYQKKA